MKKYHIYVFEQESCPPCERLKNYVNTLTEDERAELDFVPLFQERDDLIIPAEYAESSLLAPLFNLLHDDMFRKEVASLPGYDVTQMGQFVHL